ncbi:MAG: glycine--tRNA ligase subunit beta, partial [Cellvibrionales bacterium]|nr:glycine--tRNA ligase subunit beta [Cellvibrionales bacterium]
NLKSVTFQHKLGSLFDKSQRIKTLAAYIAEQIGANTEHATRAAELCKTDLLTDMVGEFPDLQGIMGQYYAISDNEPTAVAHAIYEQYLPKSFDAKNLPKTLEGQCIAIADRVDTLVGIFAIGAEPTGNKDPFGLRRASLTLLKIILHFNLPIDLKVLFSKSVETLPADLQSFDVSKVLDYTLERFKSVYTHQGIRTEVYLAVTDLALSQPCDINARILALAEFDKTDASSSLASANKRVLNLLSKNANSVDNSVAILPELFQESAEKTLFDAIESLEKPYHTAVSEADYATALNLLSTLKEPVDNFFDKVMIMVDDEALKSNRLSILVKLKTLFTSIANIALLAKS